MKKSIITFALIMVLLAPCIVEASPCTSESSTAISSYETIEYLEDGSYFTTSLTMAEIQGISRATNTKIASKTVTYKNASGVNLWSFTLTGSFAYNGYMSTCGQANISTNIYSTDWSITKSSATPKSNSAIGTVTAKYPDGGTITRSATLTCDVNGNVS